MSIRRRKANMSQKDIDKDRKERRDRKRNIKGV
jgi:hypothetical protein